MSAPAENPGDLVNYETCAPCDPCIPDVCTYIYIWMFPKMGVVPLNHLRYPRHWFIRPYYHWNPWFRGSLIIYICVCLHVNHDALVQGSNLPCRKWPPHDRNFSVEKGKHGTRAPLNELVLFHLTLAARTDIWLGHGEIYITHAVLMGDMMTFPLKYIVIW